MSRLRLRRSSAPQTGRRELAIPGDDAQFALVRLDQRGQALDPVAVVAVKQAVDWPNLGLVDVPADDAVKAMTARLAQQYLLESGDEADGILDAVLEVLGQAPVGQSEPHANTVEVIVEPQDEVIERVADVGQPAGVQHHAVGKVTVHDPQAPPVAQRVHGILPDRHLPEVQSGELPADFVVVAGDVDDMRALARLAQHLLHDVVVRLRPVKRLLQCPAVDDVANEVERVGLVVAQEVEQEGSLAAARAEMDVRDEDRAVALRRWLVRRLGIRVEGRQRQPRIDRAG